MHVMKFGGTSMGSAKSIQNVAEIINKRIKRKPVIVVSAVSGVTNMLIELAHMAEKGQKNKIQEQLSLIEQKHVEIVSQLFPEEQQGKVLRRLVTMIEKLEEFVTGITLIKELSKQSHNYISSYGERLSATLFAEYLSSINIDAEALMADKFIITDENLEGGHPLESETRAKAKPAIQKIVRAKKIPVITGFLAKTKNGKINTLGRGGSDFTASIIGAVMNAKMIQIWTDVSGIYTTDPRICKHAKPHRTISFREASELARFGARVIHPKTILPAIDNKIPIVIKNTFKPNEKGTIISFDASKVPNTVKAIALKKNIDLLTIETPEMLMTFGFMSIIFDTFNKHNVPVDMIATSEVSVSVSVDHQNLDKLVKSLKKLGNITVEKNLTIISIVGKGLQKNSKINAQILTAIAKNKIETKVISQDATQSNFQIIVKSSDANKAVNDIHKLIFQI